jgi:hypothetical protein
MKSSDALKPLSEEQKKEAQDKLQTVENWCEVNGYAEKEEYETKQKELEDYFAALLPTASADSSANPSEQMPMPTEEKEETFEPKIEEID